MFHVWRVQGAKAKDKHRPPTQPSPRGGLRGPDNFLDQSNSSTGRTYLKHPSQTDCQPMSSYEVMQNSLRTSLQGEKRRRCTGSVLPTSGRSWTEGLLFQEGRLLSHLDLTFTKLCVNFFGPGDLLYSTTMTIFKTLKSKSVEYFTSQPQPNS